MKILLSIKPQFADKIFSGEKRYEFRRTIFKNKEVKTVIVYASSPVQKIIGEFEIDTILCQSIGSLWNHTKHEAGITKQYFDEYFTDKAEGFAIRIKNVKKYKRPQCIRKDYNASPPQSFLYIRV